MEHSERMGDPSQLFNQQAAAGGKVLNGVPNVSANGLSGNGEEIRTLYVVGLPDDIKERELRNLFRFYPAYLGCMLSEKKGKYGGTLAFALFESRAAALEAKAGTFELKHGPWSWSSC
jgi:hypothetical protein